MQVLLGTRKLDLNTKQLEAFEKYVDEIKSVSSPSPSRCIKTVVNDSRKSVYWLTAKQCEHLMRANVSALRPSGLLQKAEALIIYDEHRKRAEEQSRAAKSKVSKPVTKKPVKASPLKAAELPVEDIATNVSLQFEGLRARLHDVEKYLHYRFRNKELLLQAFTTKAVDCNCIYNSAPLEFIGDRVLYTIVTSDLANKKLELKNGKVVVRGMQQFCMQVQKDTTNDCFGKWIKDTALKSCLIYNAKLPEKAYANCFESIIGAVAIDCNYNYKKLLKVYTALTKPKKILTFKY